MMARIQDSVQSAYDMKNALNFVHCDVFSSRPYSGNSLAVFPDQHGLTDPQMLAITQELRHFESIFLNRDGNRICARVFDLFGELPFAGHPIIGAACVMHKLFGHRLYGETDRQSWTFELMGERRVNVITQKNGDAYQGVLDQGRPDFLAPPAGDQRKIFAQAFGLQEEQLADLPLEVISTGLKYLVLPVRAGLAKARIVRPDLEDLLREIGAEFAYVLDVETFEGRHWNNDGVVEDVATGSAAGVVGAYALKHGLANNARPFTLKQGHFIDRPSEIGVTAYGEPHNIQRVEVAGAVAFVGEGRIVAP